jgi:TRAP-type mannitol/chloroaromatic compound transport system permease small subunit
MIVNFILLPAIGIAVLLLSVRILKSIYNRRLGESSDLSAEVKRYFVMLAMCLGAALLVVLVFRIIPAAVSKNSFGHTEQYCAFQAGYMSPADDVGPNTTTESRATYKHCLEAK